MKISLKKLNDARAVVERYSHHPVPMTESGNIIIGQQRCTQCYKILYFGDKKNAEVCEGIKARKKYYEN